MVASQRRAVEIVEGCFEAIKELKKVRAVFESSPEHSNLSLAARQNVAALMGETGHCFPNGG